jgi:hypothetical protein
MLSNNNKINRFELVSNVVPASNTQGEYYFPDLPNLRNVKTWKISAYNYGQITADPNNIPVITVVDMQKAYLILYITDKYNIKMPLYNFCTFGDFYQTIANNNGTIPLDNVVIEWSKSFIKFPIGHTNTAQFSVLLGVFYNK